MSFKDHWIEVNRVPTRIRTWGKHLGQDLSEVDCLFLCVAGNPGVTGYYVPFLDTLHSRTEGVPVWMLSHAGHEFPPSDQDPSLSMPKLSNKTNHCLFNLQGQIQHKIDFIRSHIPSHITIYLIGHSVGSKIIMDLVKQAPDISSRTGGCYLLFPTLERIRNTPAADFVVPLLTYLGPVLLFLASIFRLFPRPMQRFLVSTTLMIQHFKSADPHCVDATVDLINPNVLRHVIFLALDEMEMIKELDVETLNAHASKVRIYFGSKDDWCPPSHCWNLKDKCPNVRAQVCKEDIKHAFVLHSSQSMAEKLAAWFEEDRKETE
uniref:Lipid droplet-associated hydrolase n=1 Tax=Cacopsylla melanoneura TaxID=428564 RepID=A0A8D8WKI4_9HEMI